MDLTEREIEMTETKTQNLTEYLESTLRFTLAFFNGRADPTDGERLHGIPGLTAMLPRPKPKVYTWIDYSIVIPLLRDDCKQDFPHDLSPGASYPKGEKVLTRCSV
jgi:hypothetical protein